MGHLRVALFFHPEDRTISTISSYTGDGSTTQFDIGFTYEDSAAVKAAVDGVVVSFTFINPSRIELTPAPASGAEVRIYRETSISLPDVDFADGAILRAADLDAGFNQVRHRAEEVGDQVNDLLARSFRVPSDETSQTLPGAAERAGKFPVFDAEGNITVSEGIGADTGLRGDLANDAGPLLRYARTETGATFETLRALIGRIGVYPEQFGAVGDGTTDDTDAIQAALDAAANWPSAASAKRVILTSRYKITASLIKRPYVSISGIGMARSGLLVAMSSGAAIVADNADSGLQYDDLSDFSIDGTSATGTAYALHIETQKHVRLGRLAIWNFASTTVHALQIMDGCYAVVLDQVYFLNNAKHQKIGWSGSGAFPTTIIHRSVVYDDSPASTEEAILIQDASGCSWDSHCVAQSNRQKYLFKVTSGATVTTPHRHSWDGFYVEDNGDGQVGASNWRFEGNAANPLTGCRIVNPKIHGSAPDGRHIYAEWTDRLTVSASAPGQGWLTDGGNNTRYDIDASDTGTADLQTAKYVETSIVFTDAGTVTFSDGPLGLSIVKQAQGQHDVNVDRAFTSTGAVHLTVQAFDAGGDPLDCFAYASDVDTIRVVTKNLGGTAAADPSRVFFTIKGFVVGI